MGKKLKRSYIDNKPIRDRKNIFNTYVVTLTTETPGIKWVEYVIARNSKDAGEKFLRKARATDRARRWKVASVT